MRTYKNFSLKISFFWKNAKNWWWNLTDKSSKFHSKEFSEPKNKDNEGIEEMPNSQTIPRF